MDRNEVLERLDRMASFWAESDAREGVENGPYATALRAAAEIIRASGWRPISEAPFGTVVKVGRWSRGHWVRKETQFLSEAVEDGYTHYLPEPAPPAREVSNDGE